MVHSIIFIGIFCLGAAFLLIDHLLRRRRIRAVEDRLAALTTIQVKAAEDDPLVQARRLPLMNFIDAELMRAGAEEWRDAVFPFFGFVMTLSAAIGLFVEPWVGGICAVASLGVPWMILKVVQRRRLRSFIERLPMFLERVRQLVLIGNPIQYAFLKAIADADPIVKTYLEGIGRRVHHGASFPESLADFAIRLRIHDVYMLSACVKANARYGGRISANLANLITQLNNKKRLSQEIHAATSETRTSIAILLTLTIGLGSFVFLHNPDALHFFITDQIGRVLFYLLVGLPATGMFVMHRVLKIDL